MASSDCSRFFDSFYLTKAVFDDAETNENHRTDKVFFYVRSILAIATFSMYLFSALFETTLFNGGVLLNCLLLPVFLILLDYRSETEDETLEDLNEVKK